MSARRYTTRVARRVAPCCHSAQNRGQVVDRRGDGFGTEFGVIADELRLVAHRDGQLIEVKPQIAEFEGE
jgi:predicted nucleotidyltransferase